MQAKNAQFHTLTVQKIEYNTPQSLDIYLRIPENLKNAFEYQAGQYVTLKIVIDNKPVLRSYSISSCPITDPFFRITIKQKTDGVLTPYLFKNLKEKDTLQVFTPLGNFVPLQNNSPTTYFLYAAGSGIVPLLSITKNVLYNKPKNKVVLLYANNNTNTIIHYNEIQALEKQYTTQIETWHILTNLPPTHPNNFLQGRYNTIQYTNFLRQKYNTLFATAQHYICGNEAVMHEVKNALTNWLQIPEDNIHNEFFDFDKNTHTPHTAPHNQTESTQTNPETDHYSTLIVTLQNATHAVIVPQGTTILNACLDANIDAPFMCEEGICNSCKAKLIDGQTDTNHQHSLSEQEINEGYRLTCQTQCLTPIVEINFDV